MTTPLPTIYMVNHPDCPTTLAHPLLAQQNCDCRLQPCDQATDKAHLPLKRNAQPQLPPTGLILPALSGLTPKADAWKVIVRHWVDGIPENGIRPLREWPKEWQTGAQAPYGDNEKLLHLNFWTGETALDSSWTPSECDLTSIIGNMGMSARFLPLILNTRRVIKHCSTPSKLSARRMG